MFIKSDLHEKEKLQEHSMMFMRCYVENWKDVFKDWELHVHAYMF